MRLIAALPEELQGFMDKLDTGASQVYFLFVLISSDLAVVW